MISQNDYQTALSKIGRKFKNPNINWFSWYMQHSYYESMWNNYFQIFLTNYSSISHTLDMRYIFWESCPGGMPFPHQNYAFDSNRFNNTIDGSFDSYLKNECKYLEIDWFKRKIGDLIIDFANKGVLIIDLYPTHGVTLDPTNRKNLFSNLFGSYSIDKLSGIGSKTATFHKSHEIKVTKELWNAGINNKMSPVLKHKIQIALGLKCPPIFFYK